MERRSGLIVGGFFDGLSDLVRKCVFRVLMVGPIPNHIAFIMDGNRRFAAKWSMAVSEGYREGSASLKSILEDCYQLGVRYVTVYAFSHENFKRKPKEVQHLMDLMVEKIKELLKGSVLKKHGTRLYFIGNLGLLSERVRPAADRAMKATTENSRTALLICLAYTSSDEIVHAVQESCEEKLGEELSEDEQDGYGKPGKTPVIKLEDIERHMYMAVAPDPDMVIRSSGETRLSNFLLWQMADSPLYSPDVLWPEIGYRQLLWGIIQYQRSYPYLQKIKKHDY